MLAVCVALACPLSARATELEYPVKAQVIDRFTRFVDWPNESFSGPDAPFVLCMLGESPIEPHLERVAQRRIKDRRVELRRLRPDGPATGCHVLFIGLTERSRVKQIVAKVSGKPVLTIGDTEGFANKGVIINLILDEESHVRFEICSPELRKSGLNVSAQLLRLARVVTEVEP